MLRINFGIAGFMVCWTILTRSKWLEEKKNLCVGDVVIAGVQKHNRAVAPISLRARMGFSATSNGWQIHSGVCYLQFLRAAKLQKCFCTSVL